MSDFVLHNNTVLRGFLAHMQSQAREQAALYFEREQHPDAANFKRFESAAATQIRENWESLSRDLVIVIGPEAQLKPYNQLAHPGTFSVLEGKDYADPFRITMKALKLLADKARRKHPEVTLLKSWNIEEHEPPEKDDGE
jgi:hypothetical protein